MSTSTAQRKKNFAHTVSQAVSPSKRPSTNQSQTHYSTISGPGDLSTVNPRAPKGLTKKEVEIEHLQTALFSVSSKLEVFIPPILNAPLHRF